MVFVQVTVTQDNATLEIAVACACKRVFCFSRGLDQSSVCRMVLHDAPASHTCNGTHPSNVGSIDNATCWSDRLMPTSTRCDAVCLVTAADALDASSSEPRVVAALAKLL